MKTSQRDELQGRRSTGMRSKLNLTGSTDQRIGQKLRLATMPLGRVRVSGLPISRMPMEWMDAGSWRLPSGKALAEFALQAGFLAPLMMNGPGIRKKKLGPKPVPPSVTPVSYE